MLIVGIVRRRAPRARSWRALATQPAIGLHHVRRRPWGFAGEIIDVSRHTSVDTLRGHVRTAAALRDHVSAGLLCSPPILLLRGRTLPLRDSTCR
jgi:hypothetical protein